MCGGPHYREFASPETTRMLLSTNPVSSEPLAPEPRFGSEHKYNESSIGGANPEFDRYAAAYSELLRNPIRDLFSSDSGFFHRRKWMVIQDFLARFEVDASSLSWLDVGCGRGELLRLAGGNFVRAVGCDPSFGMMRSCTLAEVSHQSSPTDLPFDDLSFDLITAVCVYHHVDKEEREALTRSIYRVLKPGGLFCLVEHNPWNPITRRIVRACPVDSDAKLLNASAAQQITCSAGLEMIDSAYFLYLPERIFRHFPKIENSLRKCPLGGQFAVFCRKAVA